MACADAINAGESVLREHLGTCNPGSLFNHRHVATAIYEAMSAIEPLPKPTSSLTLKLDTGGLEAALAQFSADVAAFKAIVESAEAAT
jgi:hypothetical protein